MTDKPPRPSLMVVAFGVAILAATFRAMQTGLWSQEVVFAFAIAYGSTLVLGYGVLSGPVAFTGMLADSQANLTEKAKHIHTAKTLGDPQVGQAAGATKPKDELQEAWRGWTEGKLAGIRDGKHDGPHYSGGMDAIMDYPLWKIWTHILLGLKLIEPVIDRQRTVFARGVNAESAILAVRAAGEIPLPPQVTYKPLANTEAEKQP